MTCIQKRCHVIDLHNLLEKVVCLTLDVESDYAGLLEEPSFEGLSHIESLMDFLKEKEVPLTCFVQGSLFETNPHELRKLLAMKKVEFELHSYLHEEKLEGNMEFEVKKGKEVFKKFVGKSPIGYRSPLGIIDKRHFEILAANDFKFDSSVFPSVRPGVFKNLDKPTTPYLVNDTRIIEFPFTVFSRLFRITIGLSYIKLLGKPYSNLLKASKLPDFILFGFHLHDLFKLNSSNKIPLSKFSPMYRLIYNRLYRKQQSNGLATFDKVITLFLQKGYTFSKLRDIYELLSEKHE